MVGVNFGKTTVVNTEEEFNKEVERRKMKNVDKVKEKIKEIVSKKEKVRVR